MRSFFSSSGSSQPPGFTLIELLVAVTVMMLVVGSGIAAFITFNDKQTLRGAAKELQTYLRGAQIKAHSGDKPPGCDKLLSYAVRGNAGSNQITSLAVCENDDYLDATYALPLSITLDQALDMEFQVLYGGVKNAGTITVSNANQSYAFVVNSGGEMSEGDYVE